MLHVMKIQTILDRLQCDVRSIYGIEPQLRVSRVPLYEALWKELLVLIENIGDHVVVDVQVCDSHLVARLRGCSTAAEISCLCIWCARNAEPASCRLGYYVVAPNELLDLLYALWGTGHPGFLRALRQVCLLTYKSKSNEITETQMDMATTGFLERNARCSQLSESYYRHRSADQDWSGQTLKIARLLWRVVTGPWDYRDIKPSHGPGAVSDAKAGIDKWTKLDSACSRLCDKLYPVSEYFVPSPGLFLTEGVASRASWTHSVAKLAVVPKDKRGPRIICTQPTWAMWIQQGQRRNLEATIQRSRLLKTARFERVSDRLRVVSSSIKFDNQEQNGSLALESSRTRELATIDLRDASDLVSWGLVRYLSNKEVSLALAASRASHVQCANGELVKLHMYAPMGSAMCFPVESLVFWVIAAAAMHVSRGVNYETLCHKPSAISALTSCESECFVFGDDVLVPRKSCRDVCDAFEMVGFKPNYQKTFSEGFYRESCGVDAYKGDRLDICRLQVSTVTSMPEAYATIDLANRARRAGLLELSCYLECQVENYLGFGIAAGNCGGALWEREFPCDRWGSNQALQWNMSHKRKIRYNMDLQRWEAWSIIARPRLTKAPQDGRCRLFRGLTSGVDEHMGQRARDGSLSMDWLSPDSTQFYPGWVKAF